MTNRPTLLVNYVEIDKRCTQNIVCSLFNVSFAVTQASYIVSNEGVMNWKGRGRKRSWPNLRYCPGICLEELRIAGPRVDI
jgi:hypothetical protein